MTARAPAVRRAAGSSGAAGDALAAGWSPLPSAARTTQLSVGLVVLAALAGILAPAAMGRAGPLLLVAAGVLGLPHGAVDHLALGWAWGRTGAVRPAVLLVYATAALVTAATALLVPLPALLVLFVLSAAHFAEGEAAFDRLRGGNGLLVPAVALGTAIVAVPLVLRPAESRPLLVALDPGLPAVLASARVALLASTALLVALGLTAALRAGDRRVAGELTVVCIAVAFAPPLAVFSLWFAGWHGPRHMVRLLALEPDGNGRQRALRLARGCAPPTAVALVGMAALALLLGGLPGAVLVVLLALTVPHAAVVADIGRLKPRSPS